jgi:hypothetical protein
MRSDCVNLRGENKRHCRLEGLIGSAVSVQVLLSAALGPSTITVGVTGEWLGLARARADELVRLECHHLGLAALSVVFPGETHLSVGKRDEPAVGDSDAMGVAAEIGQHLFGAAEWWFGVDHLVEATPNFAEATCEGLRFGKIGEMAEEPQLAGREGVPQLLQEQPAECSTWPPSTAVRHAVMAPMMRRSVFSALSGMRLFACLIVAPQRGYDEPAILSYAISSFCPTSADGLQAARTYPAPRKRSRRSMLFAATAAGGNAASRL